MNQHKLGTGLLCALLLGCSVAAFAEEESPRAFVEYPEALGVFYGEVGGMGLSYHQWLTEIPGAGVNVAFGVLYSPGENSNFNWGSVLDYSIGVEYQQSVYGEDFAPWLTGQLYLWGGLNHRGYIERIYDYDYDTEVTTYDVGPFSPTVTVGVGIGIEVILFRHFSFPAEVGYAATYDFGAPTFADGLNIRLVPQGGIRYRY